MNGRILIVDDNEGYVASLQTILRTRGYVNAAGFTDSVEALDVLKSSSCDLLILDMHMPELSGIELLSKLKEAGAMDDPFPVLILTGDSDPGLRDTALAMGTMDYLVKPFRMAEVVLRVRNLLRMRMLHQEVRQHAEQLESKVRERTRQLVEAHQETVRRLTRAAEFRDDITGKHILRVGEIACALARELGIDHGLPQELLFAAQLHDIGKIGIPDAILLKPGKLTDEEFDFMKTHTTLGERILGDSPASPLLRLAAVIAVSHHERWDGRGYPNGLAGGDIPLPGRITAVADVYDALTHDRPYKKAWSPGDALVELESLSGRAFDPRVIEAFAALVGEGRLPDSVRDES